MHHPVEVVYKIYSIEEAVVEDRSQVEEVDHRYQSGAIRVIQEVVNHRIAEGVEAVVEVEHVVLANNVNDDIEMMRITIQIS